MGALYLPQEAWELAGAAWAACLPSAACSAAPGLLAVQLSPPVSFACTAHPNLKLQRKVETVGAELAEMRSRYQAATTGLEAEQRRSAAAAARAEEAAGQLSGMKERYREVLQKLENELDHSASLEVRQLAQVVVVCVWVVVVVVVQCVRWGVWCCWPGP